MLTMGKCYPSQQNITPCVKGVECGLEPSGIIWGIFDAPQIYCQITLGFILFLVQKLYLKICFLTPYRLRTLPPHLLPCRS